MMLVPEGGLGNRMRAIASAVELCKDLPGNAEIVWFRDKELNARFDELFKEINLDGINVREASFIDYLLYRRPRRRNLGIPQLFQKMIFKDCLYAHQMEKMDPWHHDFKPWVSKGNVYVHFYSRFAPYKDDMLRLLFSPSEELEKRIEERCKDFSDYTIGCQIRRTDHTFSIEKSPTELFIKKMDSEISNNPNVKIYLATDDEVTKNDFKLRYPDRIICADTPANRDTKEGMKDGLVEMFCLARTCKIYGSFRSSYAEVAAALGNTPLETVKSELV